LEKQNLAMNLTV